MEDASRPGQTQYQDSTRSLLVVLVVVSVLAAGVLAVADVPGLIGNRWQVVGAASAALTVVALLVAVFVVLRALDPIAEEEPVEVSAVPLAPPPSTTDDASPEDAADEDAGGGVNVAVEKDDAPVVERPSRRAQRQVATRYHRARSAVAVALVLGFLGMAGMTVAAVVDGNNVEQRARTILQEQLDADQDGPITEPQAVAVQLTTPGLQRVADAMGCTGQQIGARPVQGWAVSGTYRNPTVVLFGPTAGCKNVELLLAPRDGFVYPTIGVPTTLRSPNPTPTTPRPAITQPAITQPAITQPATTPTSAAP